MKLIAAFAEIDPKTGIGGLGQAAFLLRFRPDDCKALFTKAEKILRSTTNSDIYLSTLFGQPPLGPKVPNLYLVAKYQAKSGGFNLVGDYALFCYNNRQTKNTKYYESLRHPFYVFFNYQNPEDRCTGLHLVLGCNQLEGFITNLTNIFPSDQISPFFLQMDRQSYSGI